MIEKIKNPCPRLGNFFGRDKGSSFAGNVYSVKAYCPTINCAEGGYRQVMIIEDKDNTRP